MPRARVWIVDDSPLEAELSRRTLASQYDLEVIRGGAACLERLAAGVLPDALLLDWQMPDVSGIDVCRFVRTTWDRSALPILILTATEVEDEVVSALDAGANDFVTKPCNPAILNARVEALAERRQLFKAHQEEAALRERFMGIVSHDLRQPLQTVAMGASLLKTLSDDDRRAQVAERLIAAAARMERMISDILDLTRGRAGEGIPIARREVDVSQLYETVMEDLRHGHPNAVLELTTSGAASGQFDADRLAQVCTNLVSNAIEHGADASPIRVIVTGESDAVQIRVENTGSPIPPHVLTGLFDPFRRGQTQSTRGLGLGLYIVREIARGHGGTAHAESDDLSTRFFVRLPKRVAERASPEPAGA